MELQPRTRKPVQRLISAFQAAALRMVPASRSVKPDQSVHHNFMVGPTMASEITILLASTESLSTKMVMHRPRLQSVQVGFQPVACVWVRTMRRQARPVLQAITPTVVATKAGFARTFNSKLGPSQLWQLSAQ